MQYKAVISDIDGTLAPVELHSRLSQKVIDAIVAHMKNGYFFSVATGKPFSLIEHVVDQLKLTTPIIVDNGAAIYDPIKKEPIIDFIIDSPTASQLLDFVKAHSSEYRVSCRSQNWKNSETLPQNDPVRKFIILDLLLEKTEEIIKKLHSLFPQLHIVKTSSDLGTQYNAIYISSGDATKQHAVLQLSHLIGVNTSEIIGVGDHYNDFPLLMACGMKVAMGNAVSELKAIADYVAPSVEDDGIVDVLTRFFPHE